MLRKSYFFAFSLILGVLISASAFGQYATTMGSIQDSAKQPVVGALVEVYEGDAKSSIISTKSDKKGNFSFAGLRLGTTYVLSVSAVNFAPSLYPNVKAGNERIVVVLNAGDGRKFTAQDVKGALAGGTASSSKTDEKTEMSAEDKKKQAEYEAQVKDVEAKNAKVQKSNEIVTAALRDGNTAFQANNFDGAIAKYREGYEADPDFAGSAPILLQNMGIALYKRALENYNKNIKNEDLTARMAAYASAKKDLAESINSFYKAFQVYQTPGSLEPKKVEDGKAASLRGGRDAIKYTLTTRLVDPSIFDAAAPLLVEYQKIETDSLKKDESLLYLPDLYLAVPDPDHAIEGYRKVLATKPDHVDALAGLGLSLVNSGFIKAAEAEAAGDKTKAAEARALQQEGANVLQKYVSVAPDNHKYKQDVADMFTALKEAQIVPQKSAGGAKKKN